MLRKGLFIVRYDNDENVCEFLMESTSIDQSLAIAQQKSILSFASENNRYRRCHFGLWTGREEDTKATLKANSDIYLNSKIYPKTFISSQRAYSLASRRNEEELVFWGNERRARYKCEAAKCEVRFSGGMDGFLHIDSWEHTEIDFNFYHFIWKFQNIAGIRHFREDSRECIQAIESYMASA